jgi:hypothetical protein
MIEDDVCFVVYGILGAELFPVSGWILEEATLKLGWCGAGGCR